MKKIIPVTSPEIYIEAFKEFPFEVSRGLLAFRYQGVPLFEDNPEEYIKVCQEKDVIPHAFLKLIGNYMQPGGIYTLGAGDNAITVRQFKVHSEDVLEFITRQLFRGRPPAEVNISLYHGGFRELKEHYLDEVLERGYELFNGSLSAGPPGGKIDTQTGFEIAYKTLERFLAGFDMGLNFRFDKKLKGKDRKKATEYYKKLKEKFLNNPANLT